MSVFVVTKDNLILEYNGPAGKSVWLSRDREEGRHLIYYNNCACHMDQAKKTTHLRSHEQWIAWIDAHQIVSIGFEKPAVRTIEAGLSPREWRDMVRLAEWLNCRAEKGQLPRKIKLDGIRNITGVRV